MRIQPEGETDVGSDVALLQRVVRRDGAALNQLYDHHASLLFRLIARIVNDRGDAEDILQEVFLRVWQQADRYDAVYGEPLSWMVRIARNRAIDTLRARKTRPVSSESADAQPARTTGVQPDDTATVAQTRQAIDSALITLDADQRLLIVHAFFLGYTQTELAARFALPLGTVKTRIRRGMRSLRPKLQSYEP